MNIFVFESENFNSQSIRLIMVARFLAFSFEIRKFGFLGVDAYMFIEFLATVTAAIAKF